MSLDWVSIDAISNMLMAIVTCIALLYTWNSTKKAREDSQLREKLLFYSRLMSGMTRSHKQEIKTPEDIDYDAKSEFLTYLRTDSEVQRKYAFLAEPELNELLREIIPHPRDLASSFDDAKEEQVGKAILCVYRDFDRLLKKYHDS